MKRTVQFIFLPALLITLFFVYGCPSDLDYPPDTPGTVKIDNALLGTWTCVMDTCFEMKVVKVAKKDDFSYTIDILEKGDSYLAKDIEFTGYVTKIDSTDFLYSKEESTGKYYIYHYVVKGKSLSIYDIRLLEKGILAATSTEALRTEISASLKKAGALTGRVDFRKK